MLFLLRVDPFQIVVLLGARIYLPAYTQSTTISGRTSGMINKSISFGPSNTKSFFFKASLSLINQNQIILFRFGTGTKSFKIIHTPRVFRL